MTKFSLIILLALNLSLNVFAAKSQKKIDNKTLNVDGEFQEEDQELKYLRDELSNVKGLKRGYQNKSKVYEKLTTESEELKDNFENYIENRVEYEYAIGDYNNTIECLKNGDATKCRPDLVEKHEQRDQLREEKRQRRKQRRAPQRNYPQQSKSNYNYNQNNGYRGNMDRVQMRSSAPRRQMYRTSHSSGEVFIQQVDLRISQRSPELLSCYKMGSYRQQGVLKVQLKISGNGNLSHVGYEDTTQINDPRVVNCLTKVLYSIHYPQTPSRRLTTVKKPFVFNLM